MVSFWLLRDDVLVSNEIVELSDVGSNVAVKFVVAGLDKCKVSEGEDEEVSAKVVGSKSEELAVDLFSIDEGSTKEVEVVAELLGIEKLAGADSPELPGVIALSGAEDTELVAITFPDDDNVTLAVPNASALDEIATVDEFVNSADEIVLEPVSDSGQTVVYVYTVCVTKPIGHLVTVSSQEVTV